MSKLTKRLQTIADIVSGNVVCDVGCDHGLLSEYLLANQIIDYVYISDISKSSLNKAEKLLSTKYPNQYKSICTDGLKGYKGIDNIDECIISGMGGVEIINIIKNSPIDINSYILSPQHNIIEVKKYVLSIGYNIIYDIIVKDKNKFYTILKCVKMDKIDQFSDQQLLIGKDNYNNPISDVKEYIDHEINKYQILLDRVNNSKKNELMERCEYLRKAKKEIINYE